MVKTSWEIPLWVRITILAKGRRDKTATDSTAWSCSHLGPGCTLLVRVIYRHQTGHMCKAEHTQIFSGAEPVNTPGDITLWFGRYTNPILLFEAVKQKNSWRCLMLYLCRNVPDQLPARWSHKSIVMLKQHLLHIWAGSNKSSSFDTRHYPSMPCPLWKDYHHHYYLYRITASSLGGDKRLPGLTRPNKKGDAPFLQTAPKRDLGPGSRSAGIGIPDSLPGVLILALIVSQPSPSRRSFAWTAGPN